MGGFFGLGGSSAKTDRANQLQDTQNLFNVFSYALPQAEQGQAAGSSNLGSAANYFQKLLTAGRTSTAANAAPAINSALATSDAAKRQQATQGTGRTGGTAEANRAQGASTSSTIDSIINSNLIGGEKEGAQGLQGIGATELGNASTLLGTGANIGESLLNNATESRAESFKENQQVASEYGGAAATALTHLPQIIAAFGF